MKVECNPEVIDFIKEQNLGKEQEELILKSIVNTVTELTEINNNSYGHLKISTVTITINKTNDELEKLYNNISNELKGFKTFSEAADFIFYNSGGFIDNLVSTYIKYVKNSNNQEFINTYNRTYFLPSDVVISLEFKEWIELYKRLKYVLRLMIDYKNKLYIEQQKYLKFNFSVSKNHKL